VSDVIPIATAGAASPREVLPIDVALVLYEFDELIAPSVEYQIVRPKDVAPALPLRVEFRAERVPDLAGLQGAIERRFRERLGIALSLDMLPWGSLPRFDYKAARVVSA
jgi:phenylacetate-coenzyme A ligase PaaK-like adenylate-forming protein